jgi:uncharacterized protein YegP (UPF0339 family)
MSTSNREVEFFEDEAGEWRWRVRSGNGKIVAIPGEGFGSKAAAVKAFRQAVVVMVSALDRSHLG